MLHIFYDLDGTITNPKLGITSAIAFALRKLGHEPPDADGLAFYIGWPLKQIFQDIVPSLSKDDVNDAVQSFREYYWSRGYQENALYTGIKDHLEVVSSGHNRVNILTIKRTDIAARIIKHFEIQHHFDHVYGGGLSRSKESILKSYIATYKITNPSSVLMIGDRSIDIESARSVGACSIAVTWGFGSGEELSEVDPTHIADSIPELTDLVLQMDRR
jgi:phosphoglycolate phosphatase